MYDRSDEWINNVPIIVKEKDMPITMTELLAYVNKPISDVCFNDFSSADQNHCAHFVSHALNIQIGMLCGDMAFKTKKTGGSIRCDEIYNGLRSKGPWSEKPDADNGLLIFVLSAKNISQGRMQNVPQKHVGIHFMGQVFNFSNSQHKVVVDSSVEVFHNKFKKIYAGNDISLFYGVVP
jgi:hypothetical protein